MTENKFYGIRNNTFTNDHWSKKMSPPHAPHEANFLKLDCSRIKTVFGWRPRWNIDTAVEKTVEWSKAWQTGKDVREVMNRQIDEFLSTAEKVDRANGAGGENRVDN